uniref:alpha-1,6-mannosyl-glycoprotein 6-beta-N-acetylglucosaminyltransferase n=1 Tax=Cyprinus carpio TaxID=7962 RepID=A0A8C2BD47_CYPCA
MGSVYLWKLSSQKLGFFLVSFGFIWGMMLLHFTIQQRATHESSAQLRMQILDLSKRYIKALAEENQSVMDGPYVGTMTAYDLKKTLAVLLDNIMQRLSKLESKVDNIIYNGTSTNLTNGTGTPGPNPINPEKVNVADLLNGAQEKCELPSLDGFPHCEGKLNWMKDMWRSDPCYSNYGVDGSTCSFFIYLSEVRCDRFPYSCTMIFNVMREMWRNRKNPTEIRTSFDELYRVMSRREEFRWMMLRIKRMEEPWVSAVRSLATKQNLNNHKRKKILVHLGLLTKESGFKIAENAFSGGPLGELVQWSDLITTLYLLGHDIRISASLAELKEIMKKVMGNKSSCPTKGDKIVELIYIDIVGLAQFKKTLGPSWVHYQCMLRVLDSFGTEPEFNHAHYAQSKGHKTPWGKWNLNPQQFNTMFPHTPDNSFLGFVVEQHLNASDVKHIDDIKRQNQSLVYGKVDNFWKDKKQYLDIIHSYMEVHGTVHGTSTVHLPAYVKNHGILSGRDLQFLLRETKLFVGLSFPYEGPAPLEAIANGCTFLNPRFDPPKSSKNTDFFKGKPTLRELTSQHPYAEVYIGRPHVWTVNIDDPAEVQNAIKAILSQKIEPYLPYEFTCEGMLQRVNAFIKNQDFCHGQVMWPPLSAMQVKFAPAGKSCKQVCQEEQLICEPSFFQHLNKDKDLFRYGVECKTVESTSDIVVPAFSESVQHCVFQSDLLLFSCAGAHQSLTRICPCRDYMKGQVALCKDCL